MLVLPLVPLTPEETLAWQAGANDLVLLSKDKFYISIHHVFGHAGNARNACADIVALSSPTGSSLCVMFLPFGLPGSFSCKVYFDVLHCLSALVSKSILCTPATDHDHLDCFCSRRVCNRTLCNSVLTLVEHGYATGAKPGHRSAVGTGRATWRDNASVEQKDSTESDERQPALTRKCVAKAESDLQEIHDGILLLRVGHCAIVFSHSLIRIAECPARCSVTLAVGVASSPIQLSFLSFLPSLVLCAFLCRPPYFFFGSNF